MPGRGSGQTGVTMPERLYDSYKKAFEARKVKLGKEKPATKGYNVHMGVRRAQYLERTKSHE